MASFVKTVKFVEITENIDICRDPKDNKYLELALSGQATCIISGDNDLLVLHPFQEISILTIQEFLELEVT
ncbi:putative toxin-antitoxin system toxin component, PIN family [Scytonema sp. UIC 10036]|uniref:putative toxin-antitoxin system toxin component, PIN family n=1 Tax=Scytonema sp. UIC 10036 TaxID=2304196 RepID=UPI001FAB0184|nr:putative toxin-antitoxin system toxin component, PIN family [Scytonema sp. UIC 10036]